MGEKADEKSDYKIISPPKRFWPRRLWLWFATRPALRYLGFSLFVIGVLIGANLLWRRLNSANSASTTKPVAEAHSQDVQPGDGRVLYTFEYRPGAIMHSEEPVYPGEVVDVYEHAINPDLFRKIISKVRIEAVDHNRSEWLWKLSVRLKPEQARTMEQVKKDGHSLELLLVPRREWDTK